MLYRLIRPALFSQDPERIHEFMVRRLETVGRSPKLLQLLSNHYRFTHDSLQTDVWGLRFPNPVGIAAGFDKDARMVQALPALGFGFVEVGTVTSEGQLGNPKPRMFRLPEDRALINRLGFNNGGAEATRERLAKRPRPDVPLGINIGKARRVPNEEAVGDYLFTFEKLHPYGDYFVVNVSSPNTPGLRDLQSKGHLGGLLSTLKEKNEELAKAHGERPRPLLVKVAPDLSEKELDEVLATLSEVRIDGVIATNTTVSRDGLKQPTRLEGGLSGAPLRERSTHFVRRIFRATDGALPIIGVGGVFTAEDAFEKIQAGASLVQLYTGFIYGGPATAMEINQGLVDLLETEGFGSVTDAVGSAV